jgi:hypothetical protein
MEIMDDISINLAISRNNCRHVKLLLKKIFTMCIKKYIWIPIVLIFLLAFSGCAEDTTPKSCEDPDFECYTDQALGGVIAVRENITQMSRIHMAIRIAIALCGLIATIMIALQGDENRVWTRPIGLIATALVTGLSSAIITFHIPENIDKLIDVMGEMTTIANEFDYEANKLRAGKTKKEINEVYRTDLQFRTQVNELTSKFANDFMKAKMEMLKLYGTAASIKKTGSETQLQIPTVPP